MTGFDKPVCFISGKAAIAISGADIGAPVHSFFRDIAGLIFSGQRQYRAASTFVPSRGKISISGRTTGVSFSPTETRASCISGSGKFFYREETIFLREPKDNSAATGTVGKGRKCFRKTGRELVGRLLYFACLRINAYLAEMPDNMLKFFTIHVLPLRQQSYELNRVTS